MIEVLSTSSFCSTPDALGFDESEKGIFGSLKKIAQLPPGSPKEGDRVADSAAGAAENWVIEEASKESPATGTGEWLDLIDWLFRRAFADVFCAFSDKQSKDRPKSPPATANVDLVLREVPQQEVESSTSVAQEILGCHSSLVVSGFCTRVLLLCYRVPCLDCVLLIDFG